MLDSSFVKTLRLTYGLTMGLLTPIVLQGYLMLILTVPLVDQSLQMNLYKVPIYQCYILP